MKILLSIILSIVMSVTAMAHGPYSPEPNQPIDVDAPVLATDFALLEITGDTLALSDLKGTLVVLDFWGTWCGWCVKGFPKLKEFYSKHQGEFEIISVNCGDKIEAWQRAVKLLQLPWRNVFQERDNKVSRAYSIKGFPTKIVINEEGYMIYSVSGEDPRFYDKMEKILKERRKK